MQQETEICIRPSLGLMLAVLLFAAGEDGCAAIFSCAFLHEAGHILCVWAYGGWLNRIELDFSGGRIRAEGVEGRMACMLCLLAGPAFGVFPGLLYRLVPANEFLAKLREISLCLSLWNLLPYPELDGGRILCCCFKNDNQAKAISEIMEVLTIFGLLGAGVLLIVKAKIPILLFAGSILAIRSCQRRKSGVK